ncbi:MAG: molybdenum ABC transporter ATP-binding protein [Agarilytica sp.]
MSNKMLEITLHYTVDDFKLELTSELSSRGVTALVGPSGAGKSSLLRCIAGLERPKNCHIKFCGSTWQSDSGFVPPHKRPVAYVLQKPALFSCYSVEKNLRFSQKRALKNDERFSFDEIISLCGVERILKRRVESLSGGEAQRVAMARALLRKADLLLLDEPLSALDDVAKREFIELLRAIKQQYTLPIIYVSHSVSEVVAIADEYVALNRGAIERQGCISELLCSDDLGLSEVTSVIVPTTVTAKDEKYNMATLGFDGGELFIEHPGLQLNEQRRILVRAHDVSISLKKHDDTSISNILPATIKRIRLQEVEKIGVLMELSVGNVIFLAKISHRSLQKLNLQEGLDVWLQVKALAPID